MSKIQKQERGALIMMIVALFVIGLIAGPCCCFFGGGFIGSFDSFRTGTYSNPMRDGNHRGSKRDKKLRDPRFDRPYDKAKQPPAPAPPAP